MVMIELKKSKNGRQHISLTAPALPVIVLIGLLCLLGQWLYAMLVLVVCSSLIIWGMGGMLCRFATVTQLRTGHKRRNTSSRRPNVGRRKKDIFFDDRIFPEGNIQRISHIII